MHERLQAEAIQAENVSEVTFGALGLGDNIVRTLADLGAATPFPIQAATIPSILDGKDVLARGRTGSGKTIAFGAPLVESVLRAQAGQRREFGRKPKALILAPTRELALQIDRTIQPIARSVGLFTTQIYGGVPQARQVGALKKGVDIIIGTPGRIEDLIEQRKLDLSDVSIVGASTRPTTCASSDSSSPCSASSATRATAARSCSSRRRSTARSPRSSTSSSSSRPSTRSPAKTRSRARSTTASS